MNAILQQYLNQKKQKKQKFGNRVYLRLSTQEEIRASISYINEQEDGSVLIVFKINNAVEKLIDYRKISFDVIWWKYDGLKVPKSVIIYDNSLAYVIRNRAGYHNKILVKILKESDKYCIIGNYNYEELKEMGYSSDDIKKMKDISIYDEVIVNPDVEQLKE